VIESATSHGLSLAGLTASPLKGPAGNIEFLGYFVRGEVAEPIDAADAIQSALLEAPQ
jgi:hypothetical protein